MFKIMSDRFFDDFGTHKNMVLSTASDSIVHSRMMSIVCLDKKFYFQTDSNFRKSRDLQNNSNVALCIDNIQIEGKAEKIGTPREHKEFCRIFENAFPKSYELYSMLNDEVLYEITPYNIYCWIYDSGKPYIEHIDLEKQLYSIDEYSGQ